MFARLCGSWDAGCQPCEPTPGNPDLALAWLNLTGSQSFLSRRQRLGCVPFSSQQSRALVKTAGFSKSQHARSHRKANGHQHAQRKAHHWPHSAAAYHAAHQGDAATRRGAVRKTLPAQEHQQQQQQLVREPCNSSSSSSSSPTSPQQLFSCIQAADTFAQLQVTCNTFLGQPVFTPNIAALALSRLHLVRSRPTDSHLLLLELLAEVLAAGCCPQQPQGTPRVPVAGQPARLQQQAVSQQTAVQGSWLSCGQVAAACWAFSRAGYQPAPQLLQQLLHQFWTDFGRQQQQQQQQPVHHSANGGKSMQAARASSSTGQTQPCSTQNGEQQQGQPPTAPQQWPPVSVDEALATLVAAMAGLGCRDVACWQRLGAAVQVALSDSTLPITALQQLTWGFAAVQQADTETVEALAAALQGRLCELQTAEDLAQCVWALHLLGCRDDSLFDAAAQLMWQHVQAARRKAGVGVNRGHCNPSQHLVSHARACSAGLQPLGSCGGSSHTDRVLQGAGPQHQQQQVVVSLMHAGAKGFAQVRSGADCRSSLPAVRAMSGVSCASSQAAYVEAAASSSAAAGQAYAVLQQHDPLLCMMALYKDYCSMRSNCAC